MKSLTVLTATLVLATANFALVNQANAQKTQQDSVREQIENTVQPEVGCNPFGQC